jgi:hypothetical protein
MAPACSHGGRRLTQPAAAGFLVSTCTKKKVTDDSVGAAAMPALAACYGLQFTSGEQVVESVPHPPKVGSLADI